MAVDIQQVQINGQKASGAVRITNGKPVVSWTLEQLDVAVPDSSGGLGSTDFVDQSMYEVRIGSSIDSLGTFGFIGDLVSTGRTSSARRSYAYRGPALSRGQTYWGQVQIKDELTEWTEWKTFSFKYNALPVILSAEISPSEATASDDLSLSYILTDADGDADEGSFIRWFKNGAHQRQFDNQKVIESSALSYGDSWSSDILPFDGYEYGARYTTSPALVTTSPPVADNLTIEPAIVRQHDILRAKYDLEADLDTDSSLIRWYLNGALMSKFNDQKYARMEMSPGDEVHYELTPSDGVSSGSTLRSPTSTIQSSEFVVDNLRVDGRSEPLDLLTTRPVFSWTTHNPPGKTVKFISVRVGTTPGGDNIYSAVLSDDATRFQMPANLLTKGGDYFVSVATGEENSFTRYTISHFRLSGSLWEQSVSNSTGWTVESTFALSNQSATFSDQGYQILRFQDGTRFGEIRIYANKISLASESVIETSTIDLTGLQTLTVTGRGKNVYVYLNRELILDGTGLLSQESSTKGLEVGTVTQSGLSLDYYTLFYSTLGAYDPTSAEEWDDMQFHTFADFKGQDLASVEGFLSEGKQVKLLGVNPQDENEGGAVYEVVTSQPKQYPTVNRTFSPINRIRVSPNNDWKGFAHARGATLFEYCPISVWDHSLDLTQDDPTENGWELIKSSGGPDPEPGTSGLDINGGDIFGSVGLPE